MERQRVQQVIDLFGGELDQADLLAVGEQAVGFGIHRDDRLVQKGIDDALEALGEAARLGLALLGEVDVEVAVDAALVLGLLMLAMLNGVPAMLRRPRLLLEQMQSVGVLTVLIIAVSGVFVGMVLGLQGHSILSRFGAEATLGVMVAASLVRRSSALASSRQPPPRRHCR